jgi:hypothetical protein
MRELESSEHFFYAATGTLRRFIRNSPSFHAVSIKPSLCVFAAHECQSLSIKKRQSLLDVTGQASQLQAISSDTLKLHEAEFFPQDVI